MQRVSPMVLIPQMNVTSSFPFDQLGYVLHLPLSLLYEHCSGFLRCFLHMSNFRNSPSSRSDSIQYFTLSRNRNASAIGRRTACRQFFPQFLHFFGDRSLVIFFHKSLLCLIQLVQISLKTFVNLNSFGLKFFRIFRIGSGLDDLRLKSFGIITCGGCVARDSANLVLIITDWSLIALLVNEVFSELLSLY